MAQIDELACELLERIRKGEYVPLIACRRFFHKDAADAIRRYVRDDDIGVVLSFIQKARNDDTFRLGVMVLQGVLMYSEDKILKKRVQGTLEGLWFYACRFEVRGTAVCHALLGVEDLSPAMHKSLFRFWLDSWEYQCENYGEWAGGPDRVAEFVRQRLSDPRFPPSKRWVYVLGLGGSNNLKDVGKVLSSLVADTAPLVRTAVDEVRRRLPLDPTFEE